MKMCGSSESWPLQLVPANTNSTLRAEEGSCALKNYLEFGDLVQFLVLSQTKFGALFLNFCFCAVSLCLVYLGCKLVFFPCTYLMQTGGSEE